MKVLRIILFVVLAIILVVVVGGFVIYWDTTRGPLPQHSGTLSAPGLRAEVEILRDAWGVPHIYASSTYDLFFAQGFTQAQDRWWQMEFNRHIGHGRIQELTGRNDGIMGSDIFIRTVGWRAAAERDYAAMSDEGRAVLQAFADGVNAYITSRPADKLALEYRLLRLTGVDIPIEPWTPVDTVVWAKVMAWNLTDSYGNELVREALLAELGEQMMIDYAPPWPYGERFTILQPDDLPLTAASLGEQAVSRLTESAGGISPVMAGGIIAGQSVTFGSDHRIGIGSNNWVATGSMTESGQPLLANDPHLDIQMPSIWYEIGLHCLPVSAECPFDVAGFTLPASPGIIIGHNANIAWGVTNVGADVQDTYRIVVNPENPLQYEWEGEWRDMTVREEIIRFGDGGEPIRLQVRETHLGPILNDNRYNPEDGTVSGFNNEDPLVLHWTGLSLPGMEGTTLDAILALNRASNWTEFRAALRLWDVPSQNFVYADVDGNIGYQMPGRIPIRAVDHNGLYPADGTTAAFEWQGFVPFDDLPRIFNPERDYIVTANQAVVPLEYYDQVEEAVGIDGNYLFSFDWAYGQRGDRINQLMRELAPLSIEDYQTIHGDNYTMDAEPLLAALDGLQLSGELEELRAYLQSWDRFNNEDSGPAAFFALFTRHLIRLIYLDQTPEDVEPSNHQLFAIISMLDEPDNPWWDDISTLDRIETRDDIFRLALERAAADAPTVLGAERSAWRWGAVHTATFISTPLGASGISLIEDMVNRGPVASGGGSGIVNATNWDPMRDDFAVDALPSMRMILDVSNWDNSQQMHTTGQSGHPFSEDYDRMIEAWRRVEYHPAPFSRQAVESAAVERLLLQPASR
jgi:penicillin amidase